MILEIQNEPKLISVAKNYFICRSKGTEMEYFNERISKICKELESENIETRQNGARECIFFDIMGHDVSTASFGILEVMAMNDFTSKRVSYIAASQIWRSSSDAVIMATNRIQRDLISANPFFASFALSSVPHYLTQDLAQFIAPEVIALMSSSNIRVAQLAIITFYHVCLHFPDALRAGFSVLRSHLKDKDESIIFTTLTVMAELCTHNAKNFIALIPKFHKMVTKTSNNWIILRLLSLLGMLVKVEPRLVKRLSLPLKTVIETTTSASVVFECVKMMVDANVQDDNLLEIATMKIESYLEHPEPNLRFLCMKTFVTLIKVQPNLVARHRDLISNTLNSPDEPTRMLALDLLCSLASEKTVDKIVGKIFEQFKNENTSIIFKDQLFTKVIYICSDFNYRLVSDFEWYISVLFDFIKLGTFTCYDIVSRQLLDLAIRVPSTRTILVEECSSAFPMSVLRNATPVLLACAHIVGEYSESGAFANKIFQPVITNYEERVQASCVDTAFRLYLKSKDEREAESIENLFRLRLPLFSNSNYPEVSDRATSITELVNILKTQINSSTFSEIKESLNRKSEKPKEIIRPSIIDEKIDLFDEPEIIEEEKEDKKKDDDQESEYNQVVAVKQEIIKPKTVFRKQKLRKDKKVEILDTASLLEVKKEPKSTGVISSQLASLDLTKPAVKEEVQTIPEVKSKQEDNSVLDESKKKIKIKHHHQKEEHEVEVITEQTPKRRRHHHHHTDESNQNV